MLQNIIYIFKYIFLYYFLNSNLTPRHAQFAFRASNSRYSHPIASLITDFSSKATEMMVMWVTKSPTETSIVKFWQGQKKAADDVRLHFSGPTSADSDVIKFQISFPRIILVLLCSKFKSSAAFNPAMLTLSSSSFPHPSAEL